MKKKKVSFMNWLDYPENMIPDISEINIVSRNEVSVDKCRKILLYETNEIKLRVKDFTVRICGEGLTMKTYFSNTIVIKGIINSLFLDEYNGGC